MTDLSEDITSQRMDSIQAQMDRRFTVADNEIDDVRQEIAQAFTVADKLELERIASTTCKVQQVDNRLTELLNHRQELLDTVLNAQKEAVLKQEQDNQRRFDGVNEWRGQSADRERTQIEERTKLHNTFALKEVIDAQLNTMQNRIDVLQSSSDQNAGQQHGNAQVYSYIFQIVTFIISIGAIIAILVAHGH